MKDSMDDLREALGELLDHLLRDGLLVFVLRYFGVVLVVAGTAGQITADDMLQRFAAVLVVLVAAAMLGAAYWLARRAT